MNVSEDGGADPAREQAMTERVLDLASPSRGTPAMKVGIVGAGLIIEHAHLPAYRQAGIQVAGIFDVDTDRARRLTEMFGVRPYASLDELLGDPTVRIVDCAVPPAEQVPIANRALDAGKHLLCQKPLSVSLSAAKPLVAQAESLGLKLAVNQQFRWEPAIHEMKSRLVQGQLGKPVVLWYHLNFMGDYPADHWLSREDRLFGTYGTIHYLDSARYLFGEPARVTARLLRDRVQNVRGETFINIWVEWPGGEVLVGFERYTSRTGDSTCKIQLEGTEGAVRADLGLYRGYPEPASDIIDANSYDDAGWHLVTDTDARWIPDAFAGPMLELMRAIETGDEAATSGRDNLKTLRLVEAMYESDATGQRIELDALSG